MQKILSIIKFILLSILPLIISCEGMNIFFYDIERRDTACPDGYISVPGNGVVGAPDYFYVMKYEAKCWDDAGSNDDGIVDSGEIASCTGLSATFQPGSHEDGAPWVSITQIDAWDECNSLNSEGSQVYIDNDINLDGTYGLISNPEWMAIARNIENVASNWTNGSVGNGCLKRGNTGYTDAWTGGSSQYDGDNPESGSGRNALAYLTLNNEEIICDLSGNVCSWVDWTLGSPLVTNIAQADKPYLSSIGFPDGNWRQLSDIDVFTLIVPEEGILPSNPAFDTTYGAGHYFAGGSGGALIRGGDWYYSNTTSGIYSFHSAQSSSSSQSWVGFRCVYRP